MSFAEPRALWLLALALPVVALFLVRPRAVPAVVGSLLLWKRVERRRAARARIARVEKVLSLLVHLAALAAIVLALARPGEGARPPRRIVAVIDVSASMGARLGSGTRLDAALDRACSLARSLEGRDELGFVLAGAVPRVLLAPAPRAARPELALARVQLEGGGTGLRDALELAYALLEDPGDPGGSSPRAKEVWLLSDGACDELEREPRPRPPASVRLVYARTGSPDDWSVGVVAFAAREVPGAPGEVEVQATLASSCRLPVKARATILVASPRSEATPTGSASREGEPVVVLEPVEIGPRATKELPLRRVSLPRGGQVGIRVETPGDALAQDDEAWAVVPDARRTRVFVRSAERSSAGASSDRFVLAALEADARVELVPDERDADVRVVLAGSVGRESGQDDVRARGTLLVGPGALEAASSGASSEGFDLATRGEVSAPRASAVFAAHPVMRHVSLGEALFARAVRVVPGSSWQIVAGGETPLILAREAHGRRSVALAFSPEESDLVLKRSWPLLVSNSVRWLRGVDVREAAPTFRSGEVARVPVPYLVPARKPVVVSPAGDVVASSLEGQGEVSCASITRTNRPGIYELRTTDGPPERFAVSLLDAKESDVAARPGLGLGEEAAGALPARGRSSFEPEALLAAAAVLLLVLEGYLFHRGGMA